jgi:hypothetical protein
LNPGAAFVITAVTPSVDGSFFINIILILKRREVGLGEEVILKGLGFQDLVIE